MVQYYHDDGAHTDEEWHWEDPFDVSERLRFLFPLIDADDNGLVINKQTTLAMRPCGQRVVTLF